MRHHPSKLEKANVVAGFDSQDDADEAVLELRLAGMPDARIGYYYPIGSGRMEDLLARHHRLAASVIGGVLGALAGIAVALAISYLWHPNDPDPDINGLIATCAICGALFLGTAGGMMGLWTEAPGETASAGGVTDPFVLAVDAGNGRDEVRHVLHRHGGHDLPALAPAG